MKISDKEVVRRFKASYKLAEDCVNAVDSGFPDRSVIMELACHILGADLASGGSNLNKHQGQDADQEGMLQRAYDNGPGGIKPSAR